VLGNLLSGRVTVPLNPAAGEREVAHVLGDSAPAAVLAADPASLPGRLGDAAAIDLSGPPAALPDRDPADPALVLYTSGTTGPPKGAVLTRAGIESNLAALREAWAWTRDDVLVHALPLFHVHGLVLGVLGALAAGSPLILVPRFRPEALARAFAQGATILFAVPTMYQRLAGFLEGDAAAARAVARARLLVSGSAALPAREHRRIEAVTGQRVVERYGLTETLINCAVRHDGDRRPGIVGPPLPGVELRLASQGAGPAEVLVRGPSVFALVGRKATDLIKTGGFKVGAGEVEAALLEHPAVAEAAVLGAPDADLGERIVAHVVLHAGLTATPAELADHVARSLAPHKRPREVRLTDALPRNAMGKVLKARLRS
jgi:malonyl-CoA/methylmalonyl-CoA synthetase